MKKILTVILIIVPFLSLAQQETIHHYQKIDHKPFHFGYTLGINTMDFGIYRSESAHPENTARQDTFPEINTLSPGVDISIVTNFRLSKYLDLRVLPGISLGQRNLTYYTKLGKTEIEDNGDTIVTGKSDHEMNLGSTFINLPFNIRYEAQREKNYRPYLIGGVNFRWDMARNRDFNDDEGIYIKLEPFDVYVEGGFGVDFYLPYFKLSTELKFSVGMMNVLSPDKHEGNPGYVTSIDKLKSRMVSLSFHLE
ncbi:MAG: outer membrane beta-barrel protein [Bacteroidota bacterium]